MKLTRRASALVAVLALTIGGLGACGDDDDGDEDAGATTTAAAGGGSDTTEGGGGTGGDASEESCTAYGDVSMAFNGEPDPDEVTADLDTLEADPPEPVVEPLQVMIDAARTVLDSGGEDFSAFEDPAFAEAQAEVDPYFFGACEYGTEAEVTAVDYGFEGLPDEIPAGQVGMLLRNDGAETHEMVLLRKADGVTESFDEILALPEEEAMSMVEEAGGTFVPSPGSQSLLLADLAPGEYAAVCFVPVGTTGPDTEGDGPPHFVEGMKAEFTVTE